MATPVTSGKRGRPPAESPREKLARLEKELDAARAAVREADARRYTILGEAIAAEAEASPELKAKLAEIVRRRLKGAARAEVETLLAA